MKEIEVTYKNMSVDDIVLELERYIDNGFSIASWSGRYSYMGENENTFTLFERRKED